ncbi:MAG: hypothetical protein QME49_01170, partial [bacterium]|nr:hypothetical protein [bacterium]
KLDQRVGKLEQTVDKLDQRVGKLEQTVDKLDQRVGKLEQTVEDVRKELGGKIDNMFQKLDNHEIRITDLEYAA